MGESFSFNETSPSNICLANWRVKNPFRKEFERYTLVICLRACLLTTCKSLHIRPIFLVPIIYHSCKYMLCKNCAYFQIISYFSCSYNFYDSKLENKILLRGSGQPYPSLVNNFNLRYIKVTKYYSQDFSYGII